MDTVKDSLRIVHVYNQLDPTNGGPPHVLVGLAAGQQALGHDVSFVSEDPNGHDGLAQFLASHMKQVPLRYAIHPKLYAPSLTRRAFEYAVRGADVVHMHGVWPVAPMMASRVCRALGVPYVVSPHESSSQCTHREEIKLVGMWTLGYRAFSPTPVLSIF